LQWLSGRYCSVTFLAGLCDMGLRKTIKNRNKKKKRTCPTWLEVHFSQLMKIEGARGSVVGWCTMLQAVRSRNRIPMRSFEFSIDLILPAGSLFSEHSARFCVFTRTTPNASAGLRLLCISECTVLDGIRKAKTWSSKYWTYSMSIQNVVLTEINTMGNITEHDATVHYFSLYTTCILPLRMSTALIGCNKQ
jgi:hypothetical protein